MTYEPKPFPRMLYLGQAHTIVHNEDEEATKIAEGWGNAPEPVGQPPAESPAKAPAPCAKCTELLAQVEQLKADLAKFTAPKALEDMRAGELIQYAKDHNYDIGDLKPQAGAEKILAAVKAAEAKA